MSGSFVSRGGEKLHHALEAFSFSPAGKVCADLGCATGGFTDCLIQHGAAKVYAVDRGYGVLAAKLRGDPRVVAYERTDALRVHLPEPVDLVTIDAGWTRQALILPAAMRLLAPGGRILTLVKPQYEAPPDQLRDGVLPDECIEAAISPIRESLLTLNLTLLDETPSPIRGQGGNQEWLWLLAPRPLTTG
ncbi:MAG: TlyA family rRNA (cytidine-2'-O)-methyltransferase [Phycisphaerae bacterium]|nr:MAG: methyltransferase domain-containing protein [Planctomycetia bacterium]RIK71747.1 MAG: TlyA family rRNA (cytidine-2'-O)-methyltransferase [Planctomycetota bacterium]GJQ25444.1 MAG: TlyA family rRNA (cytidine-2'-O)-methyltransferase [Phycisphaerae bacterium]